MIQCHYCGKQMRDEELKCPHCGNYSDEMNLTDYTDRAQRKVKESSSYLIIALSLFIPGSGQLIKQQFLKAFFFFCGAIYLTINYHIAYGIIFAVASALDGAGPVYKCSSCAAQVPGNAMKCSKCGAGLK